MQLLIFIIILIMIGFIIILQTPGNSEIKERINSMAIAPKKIASVIAGIFLIIFLAATIKFIGAGESAIIFNRYKGMSDRILREGINFVNPITDKVIKYDLKVRRSDFGKLEGMSADNQTIWIDITVNWKLQPDQLKNIYQKIVGDIRHTILENNVFEVAKAGLGKFKIDEIARTREDLKQEIENDLRERLKSFYIDVVNVAIANVDYSQEYDRAVEAKLVAQQKALEAEYQKQARIREAEALARSNQLLQKTITTLVLKQKWIEKWDGKLPTVLGNEGLILDVGQID